MQIEVRIAESKYVILVSRNHSYPYKMRTSKTQLVFPKKGSVSPKIYKIRHDTSEKAEKRSYQLQFFEGYRSKIDPKGLVKSLRSRKTYASIAKCHAAAKDIIDSVNVDGISIASVDTHQRNQLINLTLQLKDLGIDAAQLLYDSLSMKKLGVDPVEALATGKKLVTTAKNYDGKTLADYIDLYDNDPIRKKLATHRSIVSTLRSLEHLAEIKIETLVSEELTIKALTKVYQKYCDKPTIGKTSALHTQRRRVSQLLSFVQKKTFLPTKVVKQEICDIRNYTLDEDLDPEKPIYSFTAGEVLILLKFFSKKESFDPIWIIASVFIGARQQMVEELLFEHLYPTDRHESWTIRIPHQLTKLGKQRRLNQDIVFLVDAIPNLKSWLLWAEELYKPNLPSRKETLPFIKKSWRRWELMNECISEYRDLFGFKVSQLKEGETFCYGNLCPNAMRNSFFTLGLKHDEVSKSCNKIGNDYKSTARYNNTECPNPEEEAQILFSMTPAYLGLVDLEKGTVDKNFIEAPLDRQKELYRASEDNKKREIYKDIITEQEPNWQSFDADELFDDIINPSHG